MGRWRRSRRRGSTRYGWGPPHSWGGGGEARYSWGPPHSWGGGGEAAGGARPAIAGVLPIHGEVAAKPPEGLDPLWQGENHRLHDRSGLDSLDACWNLDQGVGPRQRHQTRGRLRPGCLGDQLSPLAMKRHSLILRPVDRRLRVVAEADRKQRPLQLGESLHL